MGPPNTAAPEAAAVRWVVAWCTPCPPPDRLGNLGPNRCSTTLAERATALHPASGVVFDRNGVLYGTTGSGGAGYGTVYSLTPPAVPPGAWTEKVLHAFGDNDDDKWPASTPLVGPTGTLYGTTMGGAVSSLTRRHSRRASGWSRCLSISPIWHNRNQPIDLDFAERHALRHD